MNRKGYFAAQGGGQVGRGVGTSPDGSTSQWPRRYGKKYRAIDKAVRKERERGEEGTTHTGNKKRKTRAERREYLKAFLGQQVISLG